MVASSLWQAVAHQHHHDPSSLASPAASRSPTPPPLPPHSGTSFPTPRPPISYFLSPDPPAVCQKPTFRSNKDAALLDRRRYLLRGLASISLVLIALALQLFLRAGIDCDTDLDLLHACLQCTSDFGPRQIFHLPSQCQPCVDKPAMAPVSSLVARAEAIAKDFEYSAHDVKRGVQEFIKLMDKGLQNDGEAMTMIPTYVTSVPNGTEKGVYLAVDLGGTNFRVCSVTLNGDTTFQLTQAKSAIPRSLMTSDRHSLFSFLAKQIKEFIDEHHSDHFSEDPEHHLQLGFTFSFPVDQKAVNSGFLIRWTKGFDIPDAIGHDVCALLQEEIDKLGLPVRVAALVNDTVGTLMARSYTSPGKTGTLLGAIFGTGTNGAYIEKLNRISKMSDPKLDFGDYDKSTGEMIVNTEWGSFDNAMSVLPDTPYDRALDKNSPNPGIQMFEKRVSGMFLGEVLRNAVLGLMESDKLFEAAHVENNAPLHTAWSVDTSVLSFIEADETEDLSTTKKVLEDQLGIPASAVSKDEAQAVRLLVHAIGKRSARLSAVPLAAVVIASGKLGGSSGAKSLPEIQNLSLLDKGIQTIKSAWTGKPPAAATDAPPRMQSSVKSDKDKAESQEELEVIDIGVDGSVVEFYPGFEKYLREALREVPQVGEQGEQRIRTGVAKDGSGVGAALIALVAAKAAGIEAA